MRQRDALTKRPQIPGGLVAPQVAECARCLPQRDKEATPLGQPDFELSPMLKSAFTSPKIRLLAARLGVPFPQAVGMCGMLWNFTADHAPRGDVGKHGDFEIAVALEWTGDPSSLIEALVVTRLLDRHQSFRLLIHDWEDHCPRYVHGNLARKGLAVIDTKAERTTEATTVRTTEPTVERTTSSSSSSSSSTDTATYTSPSTSSMFAPTRVAKPTRSKPKDTIAWTPEGGWQGIADADRAAWAKAYPACNLERQLAAADQWLRANPKRATKSRWRAFVVNWLSRSQDRGGDERTTSNGFHPHQPKPTVEQKAAALADLLTNAPRRIRT